MAQFEPKRKTVDDFNNAQKYVDGDGLQAETINNLVEGVLYAQDSGSGGTGGVVLSNNYGDSEVNGYTQNAVNGVAQYKNYYNLGAFDTYVLNGNGTVTITRQTGYFSGEMIANIALIGGVYGGKIDTPSAVSIFQSNSNTIIQVNSLGFSSVSAENQYEQGILHSVASHADGMILVNNGLMNEHFYVNIQFKLNNSYSETLIQNQPIHTLSQDGEKWIMEEWEKALNLCYLRQVIVDHGNSHKEISIGNYKAGTYSIKVSGGNAFLYINGNLGVNNIENGATFTINSDSSLRIDWYYYSEDYTIMLNQGTHAYPYTPYNGKIIHEKELKELENKTSLYSHLIGIKGSEGEFLTISLLTNSSEQINSANKLRKELIKLNYVVKERSDGKTYRNKYIYSFVLDNSKHINENEIWAEIFSSGGSALNVNIVDVYLDSTSGSLIINRKIVFVSEVDDDVTKI